MVPQYFRSKSLIIIICYIGQKFEGFCPVVLVVGQKFARSLQKKTVPISLHKPFFAPLFFRFCLNLNQMLLFFYIHANEIKSLWCATKIKYVLICFVKKYWACINIWHNNPNYNNTRCKVLHCKVLRALLTRTRKYYVL